MLLQTMMRKAFHKGLHLGMGIPLTKTDPRFEDWFYELNQPLYQSSDLVQRIMMEISDEEVVYQKGEGPELVLRCGDRIVPRRGAVVRSKYFVGRRVELILQITGGLDGRRVLDVGATSDLLFRFLGLRGVGLNISERAVEYMRSKGIEAVLGDAEELQFEDKSFDYVFCFETLEHLECPLRALRELRRVARGGIFITVPNTKKTNVCPSEKAERGRHRWHVIEFSREDIRKVFARAGLRIQSEVTIRTYGVPRTLRQWLFAQIWKNSSWFEGFVFFALGADS